MDVLHRGGVVAFPTETVYGLAASPAVPGAIAKLNDLKLRPSNKPYTLHVGSPEKLVDYVPHPPWIAQILTRKTWPGPLTLIMELSETDIAECRMKFKTIFDHLYHENTIGLRCPDHPASIAMLNAFDKPIVAPSANPVDEPPATDASQVEKYFGDRVDLILDGGPSRYRQSSTVIKISNNDYEILREGIIDKRRLEKLSTFTLLFVCSGNTCRSPMAQALGQKFIAEKLHCAIEELSNHRIHILSAGTFADRGMPASESAVFAMRRIGLDISGHTSRPVTPALVEQADLILVMSWAHKDFICNLVPTACSRIKLLAETGVADPMGGSDQDYIQCAEFMEEQIEARLKEEFE
ncbi:MAG: threonylcarbamoyl-AMP synthase [Phycisphaerae bacterium]|nr:threonylcarbamoyl-AMP synthase [Phycisphaerae bacterium]